MWCCCSVAQLCLTLCNPGNYSIPGLLVPHKEAMHKLNLKILYY